MELVSSEGALLYASTQTWLSEQCSKYNLEKKFIEAIITVESGWNTFAVRFEVGNVDYVDIPRFAKMNKITNQTEMQLQKFSFGLGQILGSTSRGCGYSGSLINLCLPKINIRWMAYYLYWLRKTKRCTSLMDLASAYNAGHPKIGDDGKYRNQEYVDKVMSAYSVPK